MEKTEQHLRVAWWPRTVLRAGLGLVVALALCAAPRTEAQTTPALRSVTLAWDPNPATVAAGFIVYYGLASGSYAWTTNVGALTTATITGLLEGTTYYFAVTSYDTDGVESDFSNEISYTPATDGSTPPDTGPSLPRISPLKNVLLFAGSSPVTIPFTIAEDPALVSSLVVSATVSDPVLFPAGSVLVSGGGTNHTLTLVPPAGQAGAAVVTVAASDGIATNTASFTVSAILVAESCTVIEVYPGRGAKTRVSSLLGATAPTVSLQSVAPLSAMGASVSWKGSWVYYLPSPSLTNNDSFAYTVVDAGGATATNTVTVKVRTESAPTLNYTVLTLANSQGFAPSTGRTVSVQFDGVPLRSYSIEYTDDLALPVWQALDIGATDALGRQVQLDTIPDTVLDRYYRATPR